MSGELTDGLFEVASDRLVIGVAATGDDLESVDDRKVIFARETIETEVLEHNRQRSGEEAFGHGVPGTATFFVVQLRKRAVDIEEEAFFEVLCLLLRRSCCAPMR